MVAVLSDTHITGIARDLPPAAWELLAGADAVLHAGDVVTEHLLDDLAAVAPTYAVRGNNDRRLPESIPERLEVDLGGVRIAMVHDAGSAKGRRARLRRWFPRARVAVYGHSHIPFVEDDGDLLMLNPGSPTDRRRMPTFTMAVLELGPDGPAAELVDLGVERA